MAIEFGMIAPVLALMLIVGADLGMGIYRKMQVENAAQAGAEYSIAHGFDKAAILNAVKSATSYSGIDASPAPSQFCGCATSSGITNLGSTTTSSCSTTCAAGAAATLYTTVSAQATYNTILPYPRIVSDSYTFIAKSTVRAQ